MLQEIGEHLTKLLLLPINWERGDGEVIRWWKAMEYGPDEGNNARWRKVGFFDSSYGGA